MKLDRISPTDFRVTITAEELAAWIAAARCVLEPGCSELTPMSHRIVHRLVTEHDEQVTAPISLYPGSRPAQLRLDPPHAETVGVQQYDPF